MDWVYSPELLVQTWTEWKHLADRHARSWISPQTEISKRTYYTCIPFYLACPQAIDSPTSTISFAEINSAAFATPFSSQTGPPSHSWIFFVKVLFLRKTEPIPNEILYDESDRCFEVASPETQKIRLEQRTYGKDGKWDKEVGMNFEYLPIMYLWKRFNGSNKKKTCAPCFKEYWIS